VSERESCVPIGVPFDVTTPQARQPVNAESDERRGPCVDARQAARCGPGPAAARPL